MGEKALKKNITSVKRLGHVAVRVKDVARAKSFYINLGMKLVWDDPEWCYLETEPNSDGLALLGPNYKAAGPHFAFHFSNKSDVEKARSELMESGVHVGSLHEHRDGTSSFYLRDPEGNWLEMLYVPLEGIPSNKESKE